MFAKGKSVVSKGKTVKEAVAIALDLMGETMEHVDIEILETESKGILGIGSRPAVIRVTLKEMGAVSEAEDPVSMATLEKEMASIEPAEDRLLPPLSPEKRDESDLLGKVWVADGMIFCKDAEDHYPLISPGKDIKFYKNDELIEKTVVVSEQDSLHVELQDDILEPQWEIVVSDDKMEAVLKVVPGARIYRRLKEKAPHSYIQLEVEEHLIPVTIETGPVMEKLRELGIVYGIDYTQIASACTSDEPGVFVIAKGNPPKPGKNGCFLSLQDMEIKNGLKERSDGTVDYREIREFPSTQPGQVLGIVQPPVPGMPGTTVTNEPVFPPEVLPLVVHEGKGIVLVGDGTKVVATEAGHPLIKEKGTTVHISVVPKLMIAKDVDLQTGNLHFVGDVEIVGSIQDAMLVEAQGNVLVHHNVNRAKIFAGSSIIIRKNIISSEINAGKNHMLIAEIHHILGDLIQQMRSMINAIHQLSTVSAFKVSSFSQAGLGPLIKILCDGKFKSFPQLTTSLIHKIQSGTGVLEESWAEFSERLYKGFMLTHSEFRSVEEMVQLMKRAEQLFTDTQENSENADCFIKAGYTLNSQLYSSGDIVIMEQGVYNSKLYAGGFIEVDGYIRGGEIYAAKGVKISEAGAKGGMSTRITVPKGETIRLNRVMEDTMIQIGTKMHKFTTQSSNVYARLDEEGQLLIK